MRDVRWRSAVPSAASILENSTSIANDWWVLAVAWHVYLLAPLATLLAGFRWSRALSAAWLVPPVVSVSAVAWSAANPFNAAVFAFLAALLTWAAVKMRDVPVSLARGLALLPGLVMFIFGITYPHFLRAATWTDFVAAAPVGLLPCPTLSVLIGATLLLNLFEDRRWGWTIAIAGLVYGAIGVFRLGVMLDVVLVAGAAWLGWRLLRLHSVRATAPETRAVLPGDELIPVALDRLTHAITIRRPRRDVWPWIAQMGAGTRAGWYSYDWLDNGRQPSATRILPEHQHVEPGMVFRALPDITDGFTVLEVDPERSLVLGFQPPGESPKVTWAFHLEDAGADATRLVVRASGAPTYRLLGLPGFLTRPLARCVHFIMERKQLLGIAMRAEQLTR
jgi:hypothetical protein